MILYFWLTAIIAEAGCICFLAYELNKCRKLNEELLSQLEDSYRNHDVKSHKLADAVKNLSKAMDKFKGI